MNSMKCQPILSQRMKIYARIYVGLYNALYIIGYALPCNMRKACQVATTRNRKYFRLHNLVWPPFATK